MGRKSNDQSRIHLRHLENARKQCEKVVAQKEAELNQGIRRPHSEKTYHTAAPPAPLIHIVHFTPKDHKFVMEEARRRDMSGNEQLRKEKLIIDDERETIEKVEHRRQRKKKIDERIAHLASLTVIHNVTEVASLATVNVINDQLELHRGLEMWIEEQRPQNERLPPHIPKKYKCGNL